MRAVDANVLVRLIVRDDARLVAAAQRYIEGGAWVSHLVLAEVTWVLAAVYDFDRRSLVEAIQILLDHRDVSVEDASVVSAALAAFKAKPNISFVDHLIVAVARKSGNVPVGTFDRSLGTVEGAARIPVRSPS